MLSRIQPSCEHAAAHTEDDQPKYYRYNHGCCQRNKKENDTGNTQYNTQIPPVQGIGR